MKQTPVQWLYDQIGDNAQHDYAAQIASYLEEAMKMEAEIPELSDEEIDLGFEDYKAKNKEYKLGNAKGHIWYLACNWYREQLKQRQ